MEIDFRRATPDDALRIIQLYYTVYGTTYPDPRMQDIGSMEKVLGDASYIWLVATSGTRIVGCSGYLKDAETRIAKVFGLVVHPDLQGQRVAARLLEFARTNFPAVSAEVDVVYVTTRTNSASPQRLFERLGFSKIGIFPNVHRTAIVETHAIAAFFLDGALEKRFLDFAQHPAIAPLFDLVAKECKLPPMPTLDASLVTLPDSGTAASPAPHLEEIAAERYVARRFRALRAKHESQTKSGFPFLEPNRMLVTENGDLEVYFFFSKADKHCALIAFHDTAGREFRDLLRWSSDYIRHRCEARYIEFLLGAEQSHKISAAIETHFVPSAYFPAMWPHGGRRYDHVAFSRTFEVLDFSGVELVGANASFVKQYYDYWCATALKPFLLGREA